MEALVMFVAVSIVAFVGGIYFMIKDRKEAKEIQK